MQLKTGHILLNYFRESGDALVSGVRIGERRCVGLPNEMDAHRLKMQQYYRQHVIPKKTLLASPKAMKYPFRVHQ